MQVAIKLQVQLKFNFTTLLDFVSPVDGSTLEAALLGVGWDHRTKTLGQGPVARADIIETILVERWGVNQEVAIYDHKRQA